MKAAAWRLPEQEPVMRSLCFVFTALLQIFFNFNEAVDNGPRIDPLGGAASDNGPHIDPWG
jgi:hypothetical protein